jgi:hypothetical protein
VYGECRDVTYPEYLVWRRSRGDSIIVRPGGQILDRETEDKIGSATPFNGDAARRANNAGAVVSSFALNQTINMVTEGFGALLQGLRAGLASRAAFQGGIRLQGRVAEHIARAQLLLKGYRIVGEQVRVATSAGERIVDFIVEREGEFTAIEVKSGDAIRDAGQLAKDAAMETEGGKIGLQRGRAPTDLTGETRRLKTIEVRPF